MALTQFQNDCVIKNVLAGNRYITRQKLGAPNHHKHAQNYYASMTTVRTVGAIGDEFG